jgi:hypothetical protein
MELTDDELEGYTVSSFVGAASRRGNLSDIYHFLTTKVCDTDDVKNSYESLKQRLDTTGEMVRSYSDVFENLAKNGVKLSIGKESDILANADLFDTITIPLGDDEIYLYVNGKRLKTDSAPVVRDGAVLVPIREVAEALGSEVKLDDELVPLETVSETLNCSAEWKGGCVIIR